MNVFQGICDAEKLRDLSPDQAKLVVCNPTHMPHLRGTSREHCNFCGTDVWLAKSTARSVPSTVTVYLACWNCMRERFRDAIAQLPTIAQAQHLAEETGLPAEEVKKALDATIRRYNRAQRFKDN